MHNKLKNYLKKSMKLTKKKKRNRLKYISYNNNIKNNKKNNNNNFRPKPQNQTKYLKLF